MMPSQPQTVPGPSEQAAGRSTHAAGPSVPPQAPSVCEQNWFAGQRLNSGQPQSFTIGSPLPAAPAVPLVVVVVVVAGPPPVPADAPSSTRLVHAAISASRPQHKPSRGNFMV